MGNISNRFYVTALEDGTTLHGNLVADKSLTQAWNGTSAVPDWSVPANQRTIYLTLLSGATAVQPSNTFSWYYNGNLIVFDGTTNLSTSENNVPAGVFLKTTYTVSGLSMPALKIVDNLAGSSNVDVDNITFKGSYTISQSAVDFSCDAQIRISRMTANGYLGVLNFVDGISDITTPNQNVTIYAQLYGGADGTAVPSSSYTVRWLVNDTVFNTTTFPNSQVTSVTIGGTQYPALQLNEKDVVDHTVVTCEFTKDGNSVYTAYVGVDDMQDPEFMYIQYNGNNGNAASLRKGETATFQIWVGTREDPTPIGGTDNPTYNSISVKLLDGDGVVIMGTGLATSIPNPDSQGWRDLTSTMSQGKATITPHYTTVNGVGKKNLTGIVLATATT